MADVMISAGDVIEVQLTSETVVMQGSRREAQPGHITNRMRLFIRETDGKEKKYDFDETELGVREEQRVAVVRAKIKGIDEPVNLLLFNLSSGEKDTFELGLAAHLGHRPFFGPRWKAFIFSLFIGLIFWLVSHYVVRHGQGAVMSGFLAAMFAFLAFPLFWWLCATWDRVTERIRYKGARKRFIAEMSERVQKFAPRAAAA